MDDEELGQILGYVQWAGEICATTQEYEVQKNECAKLLKKNKSLGFTGNKDSMKQLHDILRKKQLQQTAMKAEVYGHIKESAAEKISMFEDMHAELFVREIANAVQHVHQNTLLLYDVLLRQEKLLAALNPETFENLIPHVLFLCEKEKNIKEQIEKKTAILHQNALKLMKHMSSNYFDRLASLAETKEFHEDHHDLFFGTYYLSILTRVVMKAEEMDVSELFQKEQQFSKKLLVN